MASTVVFRSLQLRAPSESDVEHFPLTPARVGRGPCQSPLCSGGTPPLGSLRRRPEREIDNTGARPSALVDSATQASVGCHGNPWSVSGDALVDNAPVDADDSDSGDAQTSRNSRADTEPQTSALRQR